MHVKVQRVNPEPRRNTLIHETAPFTLSFACALRGEAAVCWAGGVAPFLSVPFVPFVVVGARA